jgi:hypothetical protein
MDRMARHFIIGLLILPFLLFSPSANAEEREWRLMGKTDNGKFLLYIDTKSISFGSENIFTIRVKKEVSPEAFYESVKKAEEESGAKFDDPEGLYKIILKTDSKEYLHEIDCQKSEWRNIPLRTFGFNIVTVSPILPGSAEENIKKEFCLPR